MQEITVYRTPTAEFDVEAALQRALELHGAGGTREAQSLYLRVLHAQPRNAVALHMLGVLATQSGNAGRALDLIAESIAVDPTQAAAYSNLGNALMTLGRHAEAVGFFNRALSLKPRYAIALANRGIALTALARPEEAIADYEAVMALKPDFMEPVFNRAVLLAQLGRIPEAIAGYDRVLLLKPDHAEALNNRGVALIRLERFEEALASVEEALRLAPTLADAHNNHGLALRHLQRLDGALASFDRALSLRPDFPDALSNRGWVLLPLGRAEEAINSLEKALAIKPDFVEALTNLGAALKACERPREALACFDRALQLDPEYEDALGNRGVLLIEARRYAEAETCIKRLMSIAPENDYALGNLLEAQLRCCDWSEYPSLCEKITAAVSQRQQAIRPFFFLAVTDDPVGQLACARMYAQRHCSSNDPQTSPAARHSGEKIRLAYVSGDLRDHAVAYLTAGLFEQHDRERFDVTAISLRPPQDSPIGRRVQDGVDAFVDASSMSDELIVSRMRDLGVDIAVDLSGYTGAGRAAIFVRRAAPLQVNYLGFPATMGLPCMDYLIADDFLIPPQSREYYAEQVVYLPHSFQANDSRREIAATPSRRQCGLPERGMVFCSFNNSYKLNPAFFRVWMRLLAACPGSVLWLVSDNEWVEDNLRRSALTVGISPERLIFAHRAPYAAHLARLSLADLCLDSLPFNAGTTASDALWAGVPILTCAGRSLAARMAGSLLRAIGLPELITYTLTDYEALALRLTGNPDLLAGFRARLRANRLTSPLFDTARFCRDLESAYMSMWARHRRGESPASFSVHA